MINRASILAFRMKKMHEALKIAQEAYKISINEKLDISTHIIDTIEEFKSMLSLK